MKNLRHLNPFVLTALLLVSSACTTASLTPEEANEKLVGVWKMDMTEQYERWIADYVEGKEDQRQSEQMVPERPKMTLKKPQTNDEQAEEQVSTPPQMTNEELLEIQLSRETWYEFRENGSFKQTATQMGEKQVHEEKWEVIDTINNKASILIHTASGSSSFEIEFLSDDQIQLSLIPPEGADETERAEYENSKAIFDREQ
ncbi:MAG: hypothetical protein JXR40_04960 [Pontiellaceae bacterium]|nr:hypothetical protein [Pontiellaceae bacterium]